MKRGGVKGWNVSFPVSVSHAGSLFRSPRIGSVSVCSCGTQQDKNGSNHVINRQLCVLVVRYKMKINGVVMTVGSLREWQVWVAWLIE